MTLPYYVGQSKILPTCTNGRSPQAGFKAVSKKNEPNGCQKHLSVFHFFVF